MVDDETADGRTTFRKLRGTKVYGSGGELFGHVSDIEINRSTLNPTHLIIHKGFFGERLRVNMKYIDRMDDDGIKLWISPIKDLIGTRVFDRKGTDMGVIKEAERNKDGDIEYIRVEVRFIKKVSDEDSVETYIVPVMPFDDMNISIPPTPLDDGTLATRVELETGTVLVKTEDILSVHKDRIILRKAKEEYVE